MDTHEIKKSTIGNIAQIVYNYRRGGYYNLDQALTRIEAILEKNPYFTELS